MKEKAVKAGNIEKETCTTWPRPANTSPRQTPLAKWYWQKRIEPSLDYGQEISKMSAFSLEQHEPVTCGVSAKTSNVCAALECGELSKHLSNVQPHFFNVQEGEKAAAL